MRIIILIKVYHKIKYMMYNHKSEDYKLSAVEYYLTEDKTQEEVCKIFKCSARSLLRWVDKYNENGEIKRHNRKPVAVSQ